MEFGILSIVPPIVAIALALITKEVITSLLRMHEVDYE